VIKKLANQRMAEICCRVLAEADIADGIPLQELLMMEPRSHDQKHFAVICVFRLDCPEYMERAVDILLVP